MPCVTPSSPPASTTRWSFSAIRWPTTGGEVAELKNRLRSGPQTIYQSEAMRRSIVTADRVAKRDTAVMLTGNPAWART